MLPKIARGTLADQVSEQLLQYIDQQKLKPGDLLPSETSLAASFGVSRPVVREALKNLEGKGMVEIVNGKGAMIRPVNSDPLRLFFQHAMQPDRSGVLELMEVRKGLEVQAAVLAAQRRNKQDLQAIQRIVHVMRQNMDDLEKYTHLDVDFHLAIAAASHNSILVYLVESIREALRNSIITGLRSRGATPEYENVQRAHEVLLRALAAGDAEAAAEAMTQHFNEAISAIMNPQP